LKHDGKDGSAKGKKKVKTHKGKSRKTITVNSAKIGIVHRDDGVHKRSYGFTFFEPFLATTFRFHTWSH